MLKNPNQKTPPSLTELKDIAHKILEEVYHLYWPSHVEPQGNDYMRKFIADKANFMGRTIPPAVKK